MTDKLAERLRYELYCLTAGGRQHTVVSEATDALEAQQERIVELEGRIRAREEALRPFANEADRLRDFHADVDPYYENERGEESTFTNGDLRRAKQALDGARADTGWPTGTRVRKKSGSWWEGHVVGRYSTEQTPDGYCVQLERPHGPVQIYPASALEIADDR